MKRLDLAHFFTLAAGLLFFSMTLQAQQISPAILNLDEVDLVFPGSYDREARVILDFTVKSDGSITDITAVGGFYEPRFVEAASTAVNQLRFQPATESGEPVDWPGFRIEARFVYKNLFHTMNIVPNDALKEVEQAMADNDAAKTVDLLQDAIAVNTRLFFEDAIFHLRLAEVYLVTNRAADAVHQLDLATQTYLPGEHSDYNVETAQTHNRINVLNIQEFFSENFLSLSLRPRHLVNQPRAAIPAPLRGGSQRGQANRAAGVLSPKLLMGVLNNTLLESAYQRSYLANIQAGYIAGAINAFEGLKALNENAITEQMEAQAAQIRAIGESGQNLNTLQSIFQGDTVHFPTHRIFAAGNVNGSLETVDFQCENRAIRLPFQSEVEWRMPESWGQCALRFRGEEGTTFNLVEYAE